MLKPFYIMTSAYIIFLMMRVYARTREREKAWKIGAWSLGGSLVAAPFVMMIFRSRYVWSFSEVCSSLRRTISCLQTVSFQYCYAFSLILESTCVIPQLLLLRQTSVPTVIDSFYLATLGSYRAFYVLNWLVRAVRDQDYDPTSVLFGIIQTALYIDFAWVYWTRQRVKLRGGAVVDSEDLSKGWLISRFVRRGEHSEDMESDVPSLGHDGLDEENNPHSTPRSWGARGISVSADDGVQDIESQRQLPQPSPQRLASPSRFVDDDGDVERRSDGSDGSRFDEERHVGNGIEWRDVTTWGEA